MELGDVRAMHDGSPSRRVGKKPLAWPGSKIVEMSSSSSAAGSSSSVANAALHASPVKGLPVCVCLSFWILGGIWGLFRGLFGFV